VAAIEVHVTVGPEEETVTLSGAKCWAGGARVVGQQIVEHEEERVTSMG
jgi:hypothetical protein